MTNDAIQGRLHGARRDFEWLQEVRTNTYGHDNRDQNHLTIFPPVRFPRYRSQSVQASVKSCGCALYFLAIPLTQRLLKTLYSGDHLFIVRRIE